MDDNQKIPGALYPDDILDKKDRSAEWECLTKALNDKRITNIAVTAPYDTGKSSFLLSFFIQRKMKQLQHPIKCFFNKRWGCYKDLYDDDKFKNKVSLRKRAEQKWRNGQVEFKFINVPNFFEDKQSNEAKVIELEKDIIDQLIITSKPTHFPDSNIRRIIPIGFKSILTIYCVLWLLIAILNNWKIILNNNVIWNVIGLFIIFFIGLFAFYLLIHFVNKLSITVSAKWNSKNTTFQANLSPNSKFQNEDKFILYIDELRYFFDRSKIKYIILEDMDRYSLPIIFQRLYMLNKRLNASRKEPIVFIYTLRDSIFSIHDVAKEQLNIFSSENTEKINNDFSARQESKFFDYIIPLSPLASFRSSKQVFRDEIDKYNFFYNKTYEINGKKQTSHLQVDDAAINGLGYFISDRRVISTIVSNLYIYAKNLPSGFFHGPMIMDRLLGALVYKNIYIEDYERLATRTSKLAFLIENKELLEKEIISFRIKQDKNKQKLSTESIKKDINNKPFAFLLMEIEHNRINISNRKLNDSVNFVLNNPLLRFMVFTSLIDNTFEDYISPDSYGELFSREKAFIRLVISQLNSPNEFEILHYRQVVEKLHEINGIHYYSAYSIQIFTYLLKSNYAKEAKELVLGIKNKDNREKTQKYHFILKAINYPYSKVKVDKRFKNLKNPKIFLGNLLLENWKEYYVSPYKQKKIYTAEESDEIVNFELQFLLHTSSEKSQQLVQYFQENNVFDSELFKRNFNRLNGQNKDKLYEKIDTLHK